jgi:hypothetical protein
MLHVFFFFTFSINWFTNAVKNWYLSHTHNMIFFTDVCFGPYIFLKSILIPVYFYINKSLIKSFLFIIFYTHIYFSPGMTFLNNYLHIKL